ncbi:sulfurtransferase [Flavobacterium sandaracinum]|uniref:Sulfurtransferase n=1 Tax=Flavobacterium sandaracinum TaxID=2541733 RepID=A0A4R5CQD2_9FLAO|nr:sulfurtransferase [Flavobacterium sandaracinum]TDE02709.1 sulfurtransferase [Flavobacterium sandaracinum]
MINKISSIIQASEFLELTKTENVIIVDVSNGVNSKEKYANKHLDGAIFVDLNSQLATIKVDLAEGGRHPLPEIEKFAETLANIGISKNSHVIVYDDKNGANAAARFWWMLKSIGHKKVQVLNGGIQQAEKAGFPTNNKVEIPKISKNYNYDNWKLPISQIQEVEENSQKENFLVIDVRENKRYRGENEPIDLIAGHIPGSINIPFSENLNTEGLFLSSKELKTKYQEIFAGRNPKNIIFHCGSGITACHSLLAIDYAGLEIPKLYVGSWSEWSRNNKEIATENKNESLTAKDSLPVQHEHPSDSKRTK